jgi:membrane-bound inhibitor of C-type lysozyme
MVVVVRVVVVVLVVQALGSLTLLENSESSSGQKYASTR